MKESKKRKELKQDLISLREVCSCDVAKPSVRGASGQRAASSPPIHRVQTCSCDQIQRLADFRPPESKPNLQWLPVCQESQACQDWQVEQRERQKRNWQRCWSVVNIFTGHFVQRAGQENQGSRNSWSSRAVQEGE